MRSNFSASTSALVVIDMQKYYLDPNSDYNRYGLEVHGSDSSFLFRQAKMTVIPNIRDLIAAFRAATRPVVFLRLLSRQKDRADLHKNFRLAYRSGLTSGFPAVYPTADDPSAEVIDELAPRDFEPIFDKGTYSGFTKPEFEEWCRNNGITTLVMTGLTTSQCVETTARDASERGFDVVQVEDGQLDFNEEIHKKSLEVSSGVCGGQIVAAKEILDLLKTAFSPS